MSCRNTARTGPGRDFRDATARRTVTALSRARRIKCCSLSGPSPEAAAKRTSAVRSLVSVSKQCAGHAWLCAVAERTTTSGSAANNSHPASSTRAFSVVLARLQHHQMLNGSPEAGTLRGGPADKDTRTREHRISAEPLEPRDGVHESKRQQTPRFCVTVNPGRCLGAVDGHHTQRRLELRIRPVGR